MISSSRLISAGVFEDLTFNFTAKNPSDSVKMELAFSNVDFELVEGPAADAIFKQAVCSRMEQVDSNQRKELSIKH